LSAAEAGVVFDTWNDGPLESFLTELTAKIGGVMDPVSGHALVDVVQDKAGQKGTGRWTATLALELGVAIPTIAAAIDARVLSSLKDERVAASKTLTGPEPSAVFGRENRRQAIEDLHEALYAARVCTYAQGMALIRSGSQKHNWGINLAEIGRIWKGGCIIRARLLDPVRRAFEARPDLANLLMDPTLGNAVELAQEGWRRTVARAAVAGLPLPAHSSALAYFDSYRSARLPQNLTQAQRDAFGAHTYERVDKPGAVHSDW
jgi:6-phosphogluconate dehydrogenase